MKPQTSITGYWQLTVIKKGRVTLFKGMAPVCLTLQIWEAQTLLDKKNKKIKKI